MNLRELLDAALAEQRAFDDQCKRDIADLESRSEALHRDWVNNRVAIQAAVDASLPRRRRLQQAVADYSLRLGQEVVAAVKLDTNVVHDIGHFALPPTEQIVTLHLPLDVLQHLLVLQDAGMRDAEHFRLACDSPIEARTFAAALQVRQAIG
jgi:hypothetical protein